MAIGDQKGKATHWAAMSWHECNPVLLQRSGRLLIQAKRPKGPGVRATVPQPSTADPVPALSAVPGPRQGVGPATANSKIRVNHVIGTGPVISNNWLRGAIALYLWVADSCTSR